MFLVPSSVLHCPRVKCPGGVMRYEKEKVCLMALPDLPPAGYIQCKNAALRQASTQSDT